MFKPKEKHLFQMRPVCFCTLSMIIGMFLTLIIPKFSWLYGCFVTVMLVSIGLALTKKELRLLCAIIATFCFGMVRGGFAVQWELVPPTQDDLQIQATVAAVPERLDNGLRIICINAKGEDGFSANKMQLTIYGDVPSYSVGSEIVFTAKIQSPRDDAERLRLGAQGICAKAVATNMPSQVGQYNSFSLWPAKLAEKTSSIIERLFPNTAGMVNGILLGRESELSETELEAFRGIGVGHILAVSGLHIGIMLAAVEKLFRFLHWNNRISRIFAAIFLWGYCLLVGLPSSAVRASLMATVYLLSQQWGEKYDILTSLSFSAFVILAISPLSLYTVGFQLSYCAVLGIALLREPIFQVLLKWFPRTLASSMAVSLAAQCGIFPISISVFSEWYFHTLLANLILLPLVSIAAPLALLAIVTVPIIPILSIGIAYLAEGILLAMQWLALHLFTFLPGKLSFTISIGSSAFLYSAFLVGSPIFLAQRKVKHVLATGLYLGGILCIAWGIVK